MVRRQDREISRDTQTLLEAVADFASISLVNARLFLALEQSVENARGEEKTRQSLLESLRTAVREEVQAAGYPLNLVITVDPGR